ncbi:MAG: hypothetical protein ABFD18_20730 [Syntrophomonas sp.]
MKKVLLSIIIFSLVLSGCTPASQPKANTNQGESRIKYAECLTLGDIKTALAREDLQLIENKKESPAYYQLDYAMPAIFNIKDSNQILLIYVFHTIADCKEVSPYVGSWHIPIDIPQKGSYHPFRTYAVRNVLLIDMLDEIKPQDIKPMDELLLKALPQLMFSLNDSQKVIYNDRGTYWDAQYIVAYYQNWYKDKRGITQFDQHSKGKWMVKYIGPDPQSIKDLSYEYETLGHGGSGTDIGPLQKVGKNYYFGINNESSSIPDKSSVLTMTIKWDEKEESLKLRAANQKFLRYLPSKSWEEFVNGRYRDSFNNHHYTIGIIKLLNKIYEKNN